MPQDTWIDTIGFPGVPQSTSALNQMGFPMCPKIHWLRGGGCGFPLLFCLGVDCVAVIRNGIYFLKQDFYSVIKKVGGICQDRKKRPVIALVPSLEDCRIYWAIPMGDFSHRTPKQIERLEKFMNSPKSELRSCFYHVGNTDKKSIFFISDVFPVTEKYIEREYIAHNQPVVIKNKNLIVELNRKVSRILAYEKSYLRAKGKAFFRQNIYGIYHELLQETD